MKGLKELKELKLVDLIKKNGKRDRSDLWDFLGLNFLKKLKGPPTLFKTTFKKPPFTLDYKVSKTC